MNIIERIKAPTPKFFKVLRSIGLALLAISGSVISAPVALPVALATAAGYVAVAGGIISAVSQMTVIPLNPLKGELNTDDPFDGAQNMNLNKARDGD